MNWFIVDRIGRVHREDGYDRVVSTVRGRGEKVVPVSRLQALVHSLPRCSSCFPNIAEYERLVRQP